MARAFLVSGRSCFELTNDTKVIGRSFSADYVVLDSSVSRKHAEIRMIESVVTVVDLGSRNGTYVDNGRVETCEIEVGASIRFGKVLFRVEDEESSIGSMASEMSSVESIDMDSLLSPAQKRVFDRLLTGLSEKEIAVVMGISHHTVHNHVREIYSRLGVKSRAELMARLLTRTFGEEE